MMPDTVTDDVLRAFGEVVRDRLMRRDPTTIPGLGTFEVQHHPSRVVETDDGSRTLQPPTDVVVFKPAPEHAPA
jgi:nucleoid DNA-binding protein